MRSDDTREGRNMKYAKWRQRLRGTFKWGGVTLCVLIFALWLVSMKWDASLRFRSDYVSELHIRKEFHIRTVAGQIEFAEYRRSYSPDVNTALLRFESTDTEGWRCIGFGFSPWFLSNEDVTYVIFPLWLPFLLIALPTGSLLWSDHRRRMRGGAGCCAQCGYSLTGNTTGQCPECGATTPARAAT